MTTTNKLATFATTLITFGVLTKGTDAAVSVYFNGSNGSNLISYTIFGEIVAESNIGDSGSSGFARFLTSATWSTDVDNGLGDALTTYDSSLNDNLVLSNPVSINIVRNSGSSTTIGAWDTLDLDPVGASDDIEFDPTTGFVNPAMSIGDKMAIQRTSGTFNLESGTYDSILNEGSYFSSETDASSAPLYQVFIGVAPPSVPEPSSIALLASGSLFLVLRRRK